MKKFFALILCAFMAVSMMASAMAADAIPQDDVKLIESLGKKAADYVALDWYEETNAYYNSSSGSQYNVLISHANSTASNLANFIVSKQFTKAELPVGSVIIVDSGFQYRPEGWVDAQLSKNASADRPGNITTQVVEVTEEWWGKWAIRAFNLSVTPTREITDEDAAHLRIYVPKPAEVTTAAPVTAAQTAAPSPAPSAPATFDVSVALAAVAALSAAGIVVGRKKK